MPLAGLCNLGGLYNRILNLPARFLGAIFGFFFLLLVWRQAVSTGGYLDVSVQAPSIADIPSITALAQSFSTTGRPLQIVLTEMQEAHDEVVAPLLEAFANIPNVNISAIFLSRMNRFGSFEMYKNLKTAAPLPTPLFHKDHMVPFIYDNPPDIIVATSCGWDDFDKYKPLLWEHSTHIFCTVHHADQWDGKYFYGLYQQKLARWVKAGRVDFMTLSQHVANSLPDNLLLWSEVKWLGNFPPIRVFPPVFTIDRTNDYKSDHDSIDFALQGNYEANRRDYPTVFKEMAAMKKIIEANNAADSSADSSVMLHLVGSALDPNKRVKIPSDLQDVVKFDEGLNYTEFYNVLSTMTAILPAFADEGYFKHKASSSVPAGLVAGAPLVATQKLLNAYTYVPEDAVWLQGETQTDFDFIKEIFNKPREERLAKIERARAAAASLVAINKQHVVEWVEIAMQKRNDREAENARKEAEKDKGT